MGNNDDNLFEISDFRILQALRRIIRAVDIHSRKLNSEFSITTPQMICLRTLAKREYMTLSELASDVNLCISTVNGIVDRMEAKGILTRNRSEKDRRKVVLKITGSGLRIVEQAPSLLQERFSKSLQKLSPLEQTALTLSLEKVVKMMGAEDIDASPNLLSGQAFDDIKKQD